MRGERGAARRRPSGIPPGLWRRAIRASHRLLVLDYDGTLVPFAVDRASATLPPRCAELLRTIATRTGTTLAVVSGRPLAELAGLVDPLPVALFGEHGWEERRRPGGRIVRHAPTPEQRAALRAARRLAAAAGLGARIERKRTALVLHTRGMPLRAAAVARRSVLALWTSLVAAGCRLDRTAGGIELRAVGHDKGRALRSLLSRAPAGTFPVCVGDDLTDEDAFAVVASRGLGVRVGRARRPSNAVARLPSCAAVTAFLAAWLAACAPAADRGATVAVSSQRRPRW
jgi:trehalose 6-phosphate phosphatase